MFLAYGQCIQTFRMLGVAGVGSITLCQLQEWVNEDGTEVSGRHHEPVVVTASGDFNE